MISDEKVPAGSRVYVAPISDGFDFYIIAALLEKKLPLAVVTDRNAADFEISEVTLAEARSWGSGLFHRPHPRDYQFARVKMVNLKSGYVVFACTVDKFNSPQGQQGTSGDFAMRVKASIPQGNAASASSHALEAAYTQQSNAIPVDAKINVAAMPDSYHHYIKHAIEDKYVPVTVVQNRADADFEITGTSQSWRAATPNILSESWRTAESASIKVENLKSRVIVFAYSYFAANTAHGRRTSAESCAKHLKEKIASGN